VFYEFGPRQQPLLPCSAIEHRRPWIESTVPETAPVTKEDGEPLDHALVRSK
jgi:hypothetical protein